MDSEESARTRARIDLRGMLRRRGLLVVAAVALGAGLGVAASTQVHTVYTSSTSVLVTPTGLPTSNSGLGLVRTEPELNLETESQVVASEPVAGAAAKLVHDTRPLTEIVKAIKVTVPANTTVLTIRASDESPAVAQNLSHAFAQAYLDNRDKNTQDSVDADVTALKKQLGTLNKQLTDAIGPAASLPVGSSERTYAEAQQRIVVDQISAISDVINTLTSTQISGGSILSDASTATGPSLPQVPLVIAGGAIAGLLLGFALITLLERRDRLVRRAEDIETFSGIPVIGQSAAKRRRARDSARGMLDSWSVLRHDVEATLPEGHPVLLVIPVGTGPIFSYATASLVASFGRSGMRVAVICGGFDDPSLAYSLGVRSDVGLAETLINGTAPAFKPAAQHSNIWVLPPGTAKGAQDLLGRRFTAVIESLKDHFDIVVVQSLPADAVAVARACDRTLLIVEANRSRYDDVASVVAQLDRRGAPVIGAALFDGEALSQQAEAEKEADRRMGMVITANGEASPSRPVLPPGQVREDAPARSAKS